MANEQSYTISELAEAAGVTARTIRYYTSEGLLPPPDTQGKYARYSADHRNRLALIAQFKDAYLPLHEIRQRTSQLAPAQVVALLREATAPAQIAERSSAAAYIAAVVAQQRTASADAGPLLAPHAPQAAPMRSAPSPIAPAEAPRAGGFFERLMPQHRTEQATGATSAGAPWRRFTLAPGVELHIREPSDATMQQRTQHLITYARDVFPANEQE